MLKFIISVLILRMHNIGCQLTNYKNSRETFARLLPNNFYNVPADHDDGIYQKFANNKEIPQFGIATDRKSNWYPNDLNIQPQKEVVTQRYYVPDQNNKIKHEKNYYSNSNNMIVHKAVESYDEIENTIHNSKKPTLYDIVRQFYAESPSENTKKYTRDGENTNETVSDKKIDENTDKITEEKADEKADEKTNEKTDDKIKDTQIIVLGPDEHRNINEIDVSNDGFDVDAVDNKSDSQDEDTNIKNKIDNSNKGKIKKGIKDKGKGKFYDDSNNYANKKKKPKGGHKKIKERPSYYNDGDSEEVDSRYENRRPRNKGGKERGKIKGQGKSIPPRGAYYDSDYDPYSSVESNDGSISDGSDSDGGDYSTETKGMPTRRPGYGGSTRPVQEVTKKTKPHNPNNGGIGSIGKVKNVMKSGIMNNEWNIEQMKENYPKYTAGNTIKTRMCFLNVHSEYCIGQIENSKKPGRNAPATEPHSSKSKLNSSGLGLNYKGELKTDIYGELIKEQLQIPDQNKQIDQNTSKTNSSEQLLKLGSIRRTMTISQLEIKKEEELIPM